MKEHKNILFLTALLLPFAVLIAFTPVKSLADTTFITYTVDTKKDDIQLYWKNDNGEILKSFENLKKFVEGKNKTLLFAMNAGMYKEDCSPLGLYIEDQKVLNRLNSAEGKGNFYLKPNGIFYITTDKVAGICKTENLKDNEKIKYATQSGPMLVIDGQIHSAFKQGSSNLNIRNGVGILPDNKVIFVMSEKEINFYDFAGYFKTLGCKNALYLDGFVSRTYLPAENRTKTEGNFGVLIGVCKPK